MKDFLILVGSVTMAGLLIIGGCCFHRHHNCHDEVIRHDTIHHDRYARPNVHRHIEIERRNFKSDCTYYHHCGKCPTCRHNNWFSAKINIR